MTRIGDQKTTSATGTLLSQGGMDDLPARDSALASAFILFLFRLI